MTIPDSSSELQIIELAVGRFQVPEDKDDMLGVAHRVDGVVNVWLNGSILHLECQPGTVDAEAVAQHLLDFGYPIRSA
jgi:hypothetical protein